MMLHRQVLSPPYPRRRPEWQSRLWQVVQAGVFFATIVIVAGLSLRMLPVPVTPHFQVADAMEPPSLRAFPALIALADIADPQADPGNWFSGVLDAIQHSDWRYLAAAVLVGLVWLARVFGGRLWPKLATPRGSAVLVMAMAFILAFANALIAKAGGGYAPLDIHLFFTAAMAGFTASGIWSWSKNLIKPPPAPPPPVGKETSS